MWERRVGYVYYIANLKQRKINYKRACAIALAFSEDELRRIYLRLKGR